MTQMPPIEFWHVVLAMFSYGVFGIAAVQAAVLAVQLTWLRGNPSHPCLTKLPPVESMQNWMFAMISLGFLCLTLGIVLGLVFLEHGGHVLLGKGSLTLFAWVIYACLLLAHFRFGLKLRPGVAWTILAWVGLTLAYFGTKLIS